MYSPKEPGISPRDRGKRGLKGGGAGPRARRGLSSGVFPKGLLMMGAWATPETRTDLALGTSLKRARGLGSRSTAADGQARTASRLWEFGRGTKREGQGKKVGRGAGRARQLREQQKVCAAARTRLTIAMSMCCFISIIKNVKRVDEMHMGVRR